MANAGNRQPEQSHIMQHRPQYYALFVVLDVSYFMFVLAGLDSRYEQRFFCVIARLADRLWAHPSISVTTVLFPAIKPVLTTYIRSAL